MSYNVDQMTLFSTVGLALGSLYPSQHPIDAASPHSSF